ncbi:MULTISPECIES: glycine zipper 2TM domain-containing protein [Paraburkholderia]|jgi:outer membrane lipoprotein SlyB|uniref:Outer membrane lipoprotein SlyB n=3 Tax=Paraburkholderia TaxID=1822464 RepID=A0A7Z7BAW6_9BURK|nr:MULTISPECIES: glycine zipper 2TM domain-containing protein [Paraburkholderia]EUC14905.1 17 kDa surface antigen [Burkholderia sp. BT03]SKC82923.1 Outer membrane lipoprotein SlyB [Burkholderia sp. CF099]SOE62682.1 Outer membrane lipoprotein SlyB [Burkholderia sp. YR290]AUT60529.1 glycine zipper 2TM domain-containing protein [Paraburkholderia terrae]AUT69574.1 glycine zipper 2TM domain-containing protein [Paraburkholderia hospita]
MKTTSRTLSRLVLGAVIASSLAMTGCAYNSSSADVYTSSQAQREETVRMGVVDSVRAVKISSNNGQPSGIGAIGGGALGAVAGSAIGGGRGSILTGIVGGLAGAVAGNTIENSTAMRDGVEITVRLDNGDMRAITQSATGEIFRAGERVRLLSSGGVTRVTH